MSRMQLKIPMKLPVWLGEMCRQGEQGHRDIWILSVVCGTGMLWSGVVDVNYIALFDPLGVCADFPFSYVYRLQPSSSNP
jgi:hypothetical protein